MTDKDPEQELAERLARRMAYDYASGEFGKTQIYYMRAVALDILEERNAKAKAL